MSEASRKVWTPEDDEKLRLLVSYWGDQSGRNSHWDKISASFEDRSSKDCRKRWFHSLDPKLRRGRWTAQEDSLLVEAYNRLGPSWQRISQVVSGRTDDQCAKRYNDVLNPEFKDRLKEWAIEEDRRLASLVKKHGKRWSAISKELPGRTGLTCRNRWRKLSKTIALGEVPECQETPQQTPEMENPPEAAPVAALVSAPVAAPVSAPGPAAPQVPPSQLYELEKPAFPQDPYLLPKYNGHQYPVGVQRTYTLTVEDPAEYDNARAPQGPHHAISELDLDKILERAAETGQKIVIHQHIYAMPNGIPEQIIEPRRPPDMGHIPMYQSEYVPGFPEEQREPVIDQESLQFLCFNPS